jgi:hypothetical protein
MREDRIQGEPENGKRHDRNDEDRPYGNRPEPPAAPCTAVQPLVQRRLKVPGSAQPLHAAKALVFTAV